MFRISRFLFILLLGMRFHDSSAQSLANYTDRLYFGMLSLNPDSSIKDFLKVYMPIVLQKSDTNEKWTMYSSELTTEPKHETVINSSFLASTLTLMDRVNPGNLHSRRKFMMTGNGRGN